MLCCGRRKEGREATPEMATSPRRQASQVPGSTTVRPKEPPPMVVQGDFRKVSGISTEIFRQIETVENDHDATTAAALEAVERRGEMVVRLLDPRHMGRAASEAAKRFLALQDAKHFVHLVEIVKRPGQTLGLYIREGNGLDRSDGVFISRIALESAVYNSGCLKVGDEILAVNMVDVTHMSLDDVVIIMSIPRRLVLVTRQRKAGKGGVVSPHLQPRSEHKPPPVVVIKKELREDDDMDEEDMSSRRRGGDGRETSSSRSRLGLGLTGLGSTQDLGMDSNGDATTNGLGLADLYYNSRPEHSGDRPSATASWSYQPPPPPVITEQPKPSSTPQHFQPYDRNYPKTLESLAEKVHAFYTGPPTGTTSSRRMSAGPQPTSLRQQQQQAYGARRAMPRSGSDQHLPRVEYDYGTGGTSHTMLRSSLKYGSRYRDVSAQRQPLGGTLARRHRPSLDYASDTEATCTSSPRSSYYYYHHRTPPAASRTPTLSRSPHIGSGTATTGLSTPSGGTLRSNSLPRDHRGRSQQGRHHVVRFEREARGSTGASVGGSLLDQEDSDGAVSAPELPVTRRERGRIPSSPSVFTADEYRAWLQRTPSTSAIYERIRASRDVLQSQRAQRFTYSAENLLDRAREEKPYYSYRPHLTSTLDRHQYSSARTGGGTGGLSGSATTSRATSMRRMKHLLDLEARHIPNPSPTRTQDPRSRLLDINPAEFLKYKMDKPSTSLVEPGAPTEPGVSGLLWVHLLAGRGLRATPSSAATTPSTPSGPPSIGDSTSTGLRDLYCVLECDRVHKARTVVRTGDLVFDWDETFELDLVNNRELDLLIYSWDPQYRHKLCYKGSVHLATLLRESPIHQLALKIEPRGTLYLRLRHTDPHQTFKRRGMPGLLLGRPGGKALSGASGFLFGADLDTVVARESLTGGVPGGVATSVTLATQSASAVPIIIRRCVEEVERRGLDIIGLYRLCGSATKKRILREAFERNARTVDLSPDNVPDINVITGVLKDYLRELPEPLFTKCLYQMMVDALSVCLPDDPEGNAKLMFSILDCLPRVNRCTLIFLMDHLALVVSQSERNKMSPQNLAIVFGPVLMLQSEEGRELDFNQPINVLRYLLEIWPNKSVREFFAPSPHLLASSQQQPLLPSRLPPVLKAPPAVTSSPAGVAQWSLGRGGRGTASRGRKTPEASLPVGPQQQVVVVSSPDSPTSEESSPSPSPESEVKQSIPAQRAGTLGKEQLPEATSPQQQVQTPTSSTTTEDSRKGEAGREADEEGSDEVKEEDADDEDGIGTEDDVHTTTTEEEEE
ncbi:rho GTPase-activating protein 100F [Anabrus simplex]|uniref:rho GTPase-activating protein 100F n=1 Tax=Anabrus simplex TaxID=316456 RepID=UPI0034DD6A68